MNLKMDSTDSFAIALSADDFFEQFLLQRNLKLFKLKPGSSLYNALADQLYFNEELDDRVKQECLFYWQNHSQIFGPIPQPLSDKDYSTLLTVVADLYNRKVLVFSTNRDVIEFIPSTSNHIEEPILISQHASNEFHSIINKMKHGPRKVRLSNQINHAVSDTDTKIDTEIRDAFEQGLMINDRQDSYNSSAEFESVRPHDEINSLDGLPMNVQLTFQDASFEDLNQNDGIEIDDQSSMSSVSFGLVAKVTRSNYHSPAMLRKNDPSRQSQLARAGSYLCASEFDTDSSKEDFSTDFSTEVTEACYSELHG